jgi:hypothetical protein
MRVKVIRNPVLANTRNALISIEFSFRRFGWQLPHDFYQRLPKIYAKISRMIKINVGNHFSQ